MKLVNKMDNFKFDTIESALEDYKAGKIIIVVDDEDRENEGDMIFQQRKQHRHWLTF